MMEDNERERLVAKHPELLPKETIEEILEEMNRAAFNEKMPDLIRVKIWDWIWNIKLVLKGEKLR